MFRCSDTTVCNFRYDNLLKIVSFYFSIDSIFALLVFSFQGASDSIEPVSGDKEIRTPDPLLARQVLSQLSYTPRFTQNGLKWTRTTDLTLIRRAL